MDRTLKFSRKLLKSTFLWRCLTFIFFQLVILKTLSILDLVLSVVKVATAKIIPFIPYRQFSFSDVFYLVVQVERSSSGFFIDLDDFLTGVLLLANELVSR